MPKESVKKRFKCPFDKGNCSHPHLGEGHLCIVETRDPSEPVFFLCKRFPFEFWREKKIEDSRKDIRELRKQKSRFWRFFYRIFNG